MRPPLVLPTVRLKGATQILTVLWLPVLHVVSPFRACFYDKASCYKVSQPDAELMVATLSSMLYLQGYGPSEHFFLIVQIHLFWRSDE